MSNELNTSGSSAALEDQRGRLIAHGELRLQNVEGGSSRPPRQPSQP